MVVVFSVVMFTSVSIGPSAPLSTRVSNALEAPSNNQSSQPVPRRQIVVKFGGSSLADKDRLKRAASLIAREAGKGTRLAVVVSAMGGTTDHLLSLLDVGSGNSLDKLDLDDVIAMGERTSVRVFTAALKKEGLNAKYFDPSDEDWPIITDDSYSDANPILEVCVERIRRHVLPLMEAGIIPVIAGFVGRSEDGKVSTIGRGGSDTTAFILARAIAADQVVLVTDAEGIMSADPKYIPNARRLERIDVATLANLADSGTKFIHRKALRYKDPNIPVKVISHRLEDLDEGGTIVTGGIPSEMEANFASATPSIAITIAGKGVSENPSILTTLIAEIRNHSIMLGLSADYDSITFYAPEESSNRLLKAAHDVTLRFGEALAMVIHRNLAFLKIRGVDLQDTPGVIGRISNRLRESDINIYGMLTVASNILTFVSWDDKEESLNLIRQVLKGDGA